MSATLEAREPVARYLATPPLLQHFDRVAQAPGGVARLRELILTLAVQGKLVPQDTADEPASVLLERIRAGKARLVKEGKIRKEKPLAAISEAEKPFALPSGWEWSSLAEIGLINPRNDASDEIAASFVQMSSVPVTFMAAHLAETKKWGEIKSGFTHFAEGDVGIAKITPCFENGKSAVFRNLQNGIGAGTTELHVVRPLAQVFPNYVLLFLKTPAFLNDGELVMTGSAGQKRLPRSYFENKPFPLPPSAEQSRIVARVEELMALCDTLEETGRLAAVQHERLASALFDALANSATAEEATENWQRITPHFDLLLDRTSAVDRLEQTILQLAVCGRLVPQTPTDEPASALLQKIRSEKDHLIATGQRKHDKPLPPIGDEEKPFELPEGWEWARFGDLILSSDAGWSPSCESTPREGNEWGVLKVSAVSWGEFRPEENKALPPSLTPKPEFEVKAGDFLLSRANTEELVARSVIAWEPPNRLMMSDKLIRLSLSNHINKALYCEINNSGLSREHYIANASGTSSSMKNVSREVVLKLVVPVPPLPEQSRIVARLTELRAICAQLRQRLATTTQTQSRLAEALIEKAVT